MKSLNFVDLSTTHIDRYSVFIHRQSVDNMWVSLGITWGVGVEKLLITCGFSPAYPQVFSTTQTYPHSLPRSSAAGSPVYPHLLQPILSIARHTKRRLSTLSTVPITTTTTKFIIKGESQ
jgi:hypothetical protein